MVRERNTVDITADGGGEGSATGNTLIYDLPTNPTSSELKGKVCKIIIANRTGVAGNILMHDSDTIGDAMSAVAPLDIYLTATETVFLNEDDIGEWFIKSGIVAQASNGATSNGYKISVEVEVF